MTKNRSRRRMIPLLGIWLLAIGMGLFGHDTNFLLAGLGGGLGAAAGLQLMHLWLLLFGRLAGYAILAVSIGSGHRLAWWRIGRMPFSLRWFLLTPLMAEAVLVRRPGQRVRLWVSALLMSAVQLGFGLWLLIAGAGLVRFLGGGVLVLPLLSLTVAAKTPLTAGWFLFKMPFLPADALDLLVLTPAELTATRAIRDGRIADARAALGDGGPRFPTHLLRATIAVGEGRYADASTEAREAVESAPYPKVADPAHYLRAAALVGAAETGELPPTEYLPWLAQAVEAGRTAQPVLARLVSSPADLALLEGRPDEALSLARRSARQGLDTFWIAQSECTCAAALATTGRHEEARAALERARKAMPELARIATVAERIGLAEVSCS